MQDTEKKQAAPPYVAFKTLSNFLDRFKQGVPGRIDRGLMASMSGAAQSQVITALRYLGMISENGIPQQLLRQYVGGDETERRAALMSAIRNSYPFLFGNDFDLTASTGNQLREAFEAHTSATGETVVRCMTFFKDAALEAGFEVSPYILQKSARNGGTTRRRAGARKSPQKEAEAPDKQSPPRTAIAHQFAAQSSLLLMGLFQRLPHPGDKWEKEERERWLHTLQNVLLLEYPEA